MPDAVTITGLDELMEAIEKLQDTVAAGVEEQAQALADYFNASTNTTAKVVYPLHGDRFNASIELSYETAAPWSGEERKQRGFPSFDIKPGELRSPKAKMGALGQRYIDVPLRNHPGVIRRISSPSRDHRGNSHGSRPGSWIHPGVRPADDTGETHDPATVAAQERTEAGFLSKIAGFFTRFFR